MNVIVDNTSLKEYGEGEGKTDARSESKRRTRRELHLMIDAQIKFTTKNSTCALTPIGKEVQPLAVVENNGYATSLKQLADAAKF